MCCVTASSVILVIDYWAAHFFRIHRDIGCVRAVLSRHGMVTDGREWKLIPKLCFMQALRSLNEHG